MALKKFKNSNQALEKEIQVLLEDLDTQSECLLDSLDELHTNLELNEEEIRRRFLDGTLSPVCFRALCTYANCSSTICVCCLEGLKIIGDITRRKKPMDLVAADRRRMTDAVEFMKMMNTNITYLRTEVPMAAVPRAVAKTALFVSQALGKLQERSLFDSTLLKALSSAFSKFNYDDFGLTVFYSRLERCNMLYRELKASMHHRNKCYSRLQAIEGEEFSAGEDDDHEFAEPVQESILENSPPTEKSLGQDGGKEEGDKDTGGEKKEEGGVKGEEKDPPPTPLTASEFQKRTEEELAAAKHDLKVANKAVEDAQDSLQAEQAVLGKSEIWVVLVGGCILDLDAVEVVGLARQILKADNDNRPPEGSELKSLSELRGADAEDAYQVILVELEKKISEENFGFEAKMGEIRNLVEGHFSCLRKTASDFDKMCEVNKQK